jgi:hypothetical protein
VRRDGRCGWKQHCRKKLDWPPWYVADGAPLALSFSEVGPVLAEKLFANRAVGEAVTRPSSGQSSNNESAGLLGGRFNASSTIPVHGAGPWVIVETPTHLGYEGEPDCGDLAFGKDKPDALLGPR